MSFSIEDFSLDFFSLHNKVAIVTGAAGETGERLMLGSGQSRG